ncbi:MAG: hypothetical protein IT364_03095 [Candidatus Hydrogenedentes bacterium]|nr:hypothetical protein [Candidatus Hydrogenedentota bacterium]
MMVAVAAFFALSGLAMAADTAVGDPYSLDHCVMSGKKFAEGSTPVVANLNGREIKFCCDGCKGKFEADPAAVFSKVDKEMIEQQKKSYPLDTCLVEGGKLEEGKAVDYVYNNRLVRLCCDGCKEKIAADPAKYIGELDKAVIKAQEGSYPLKKCPVSGEELGSMGDPVKMVVANQLVELCCKGCTKKVTADPAKYLSMIHPAAGTATAEKKN